MQNRTTPSFHVRWRKPKRPRRGAVVELVIEFPSPNGDMIQLTRQFGRKKTRGFAAEGLILGGDRDLGEVIQDRMDDEEDEEDDDEGEPVTANAKPEEIQAIERLVARWRRAVERALEQKAISNSTASTYLQHPENFLAWVKGEFQPGGAGRRRRARTDSTAVADSEE
jgi:hypothetical protein